MRALIIEYRNTRTVTAARKLIRYVKSHQMAICFADADDILTLCEAENTLKG